MLGSGRERSGLDIDADPNSSRYAAILSRESPAFGIQSSREGHDEESSATSGNGVATIIRLTSTEAVSGRIHPVDIVVSLENRVGVARSLRSLELARRCAVDRRVDEHSWPVGHDQLRDRLFGVLERPADGRNPVERHEVSERRSSLLMTEPQVAVTRNDG